MYLHRPWTSHKRRRTYFEWGPMIDVTMHLAHPFPYCCNDNIALFHKNHISLYSFTEIYQPVFFYIRFNTRNVNNFYSFYTIQYKVIRDSYAFLETTSK